MWIFTRNSFVSIVASENSPGEYLVQSRFSGHIERLFPEAQVTLRQYGLYRFRAVIPRHAVSQKLFDLAEGIDYLDFKNSLSDPTYQAACRDVWATLDKYTPPPSEPEEIV
jgi:hypothetical protein